ncbi:hypothetical protein AVEN_188137-1 [Araneus ventricosus]|uniref:Uncharacterized protein n=1 Tax=Araneus ventricosus TaxID=182803 RepID=A0A4Y2WSP8_ARAVE|nr:hypothetical protein AVEN_7779-1 [Araneus ventricosus]GBO38896.1 hypothetical protein AVEN_95129-1 [Araneus ventricosus]GBO38897.1 hypothetical protein AVEN_141997-1 [Araneus ventricosus]GBO38900.1 hypothetical protein AVEN_188137-1 [Araneus ventricosus]
MTRTTSTPEMPPSKLPHHTNGKTFDPLHMTERATGLMHDGSSVESGFEAGTLSVGHSGLRKSARTVFNLYVVSYKSVFSLRAISSVIYECDFVFLLLF